MSLRGAHRRRVSCLRMSTSVEKLYDCASLSSRSRSAGTRVSSRGIGATNRAAFNKTGCSLASGARSRNTSLKYRSSSTRASRSSVAIPLIKIASTRACHNDFLVASTAVRGRVNAGTNEPSFSDIARSFSKEPITLSNPKVINGRSTTRATRRTVSSQSSRSPSSHCCF